MSETLEGKTANGVESSSSGKRERSPSFPYISLEKALERTAQLYERAKRFEVLVSDAAKSWRMAPKSSSTLMTVAALLSYGLIEDSGTGDSRKIKISENGARILGDMRPGIREKLLAEAALKPKLIAEYAERWRGGRPDDHFCLSELKYDKGFNDEGAARFLRVFDETMRFAGLEPSDRFSVIEHASTEPASELAGSAATPIVEDSETILQAVGGALQMPPKPPAKAAIPIGSVVLEPGEREWLRGSLSRETSYRLIVSGELGPREIGKLIKLLKAQQAVLSDDEDGEE